MFNNQRFNLFKHLTTPDKPDPISFSYTHSSLKICNRNVIVSTLWNADHHCFVTYSEERKYRKIFATGKTLESSKSEFIRALEKHINNLSKGGRPRKKNVQLACNIPEEIKAYIDSYCELHNLKHGEFIAQLVHSHRL